MSPRKRRPRVQRHFKIDHALSPQERDAYLHYLGEPRTTVDLAHGWLIAHGCRAVSRSAVARHRRYHLAADERRRQTADAAVQFAHFARDGRMPVDHLITGMAAQSEALLFKALVEAPLGHRKLTLEELDELGRLVSRMVQTRRQAMELEQLTASARDRAARTPTAVPAPPAPTPEEEHEAVIKRVCEILEYPYDPAGIKPPRLSNDPGEN